MKKKCLLCGREAACCCTRCGAAYCESHAMLNTVGGWLGQKLRCPNCGHVGSARKV